MKDLILNEDGTPKVENGDLVIGEADNQNVALIFQAFKGEFRHRPDIGFGAGKYLKGNKKAVDIKRALKLELERDGYNNVEVLVDPQFHKLIINVE